MLFQSVEDINFEVERGIFVFRKIDYVSVIFFISVLKSLITHNWVMVIDSLLCFVYIYIHESNQDWCIRTDDVLRQIMFS